MPQGARSSEQATFTEAVDGDVTDAKGLGRLAHRKSQLRNGLGIAWINTVGQSPFHFVRGYPVIADRNRDTRRISCGENVRKTVKRNWRRPMIDLRGTL